MNILDDLGPEHVAYWQDQGYDPMLITFTSPEEQEAGIRPASGLVTAPTGPADFGHRCCRVAWKPDEIDLAHLARGGTIWLSCWGGLPVHSMEVQPADAAERAAAWEAVPP